MNTSNALLILAILILVGVIVYQNRTWEDKEWKHYRHSSGFQGGHFPDTYGTHPMKSMPDSVM